MLCIRAAHNRTLPASSRATLYSWQCFHITYVVLKFKCSTLVRAVLVNERKRYHSELRSCISHNLSFCCARSIIYCPVAISASMLTYPPICLLSHHLTRGAHPSFESCCFDHHATLLLTFGATCMHRHNAYLLVLSVCYTFWSMAFSMSQRHHSSVASLSHIPYSFMRPSF